jgi:hypothetical protein
MDMQELVHHVRENVLLKERIEELTTLQNEVKKQLKQAIEELGETDDRGHVVVEIEDDVTGIRKVMQQRRVSKNLDIELAEIVLKEKGIHERCLTMVPVLNEDEIMAAYYENLITEADIDKMFPSKITWALVLSKS